LKDPNREYNKEQKQAAFSDFDNEPLKPSSNKRSAAINYFTDPEQSGFKKLKEIELEVTTPKSWKTQGGENEEWHALSTKEKFVFLKMDPKKQNKFFKMDKDARMKAYTQLKTTDDSARAKGDKKTADAQALAAIAAKKRGLKPEQGTIKISTLNQQLQTIDPPANKEQRIKALNLVQNFLKPYLKMYNLKLSESAIKRFAESIIEVNKKPSCRIKILK